MSLLKFTWRRQEPVVQQRAGGFGKIRQAGGKALRALLPGRKGSGGRQLEALEDVEESDGVHTDAGVAGSSREGQGWIAGWKSKSRVDLLSGSKKGKGKEKERERDAEGDVVMGGVGVGVNGGGGRREGARGAWPPNPTANANGTVNGTTTTNGHTTNGNPNAHAHAPATRTPATQAPQHRPNPG